MHLALRLSGDMQGRSILSVIARLDDDILLDACCSSLTVAL
jgi:hypothetical protein